MVDISLATTPLAVRSHHPPLEQLGDRELKVYPPVRQRNIERPRDLVAIELRVSRSQCNGWEGSGQNGNQSAHYTRVSLVCSKFIDDGVSEAKPGNHATGG